MSLERGDPLELLEPAAETLGSKALSCEPAEASSADLSFGQWLIISLVPVKLIETTSGVV